MDPPYRIVPGQVVYLVPPHKRNNSGEPSVSNASSAPVVEELRSEKTKPAPPVVQQPRSTAPSKSSSQSLGAARTLDSVEKSRQNAAVRDKPKLSGDEDFSGAKSIRWRWPVDGRVFSSFKENGNEKAGVDIAGKVGQAVLAAAPGRVVYSGNAMKGYGNLVIIKHDDVYLSAYAHNRAILVREGEVVQGGQKIAEMGSSDRDRVALHFQIRKHGKPVNPFNYLPKKN